MFLHGNLALLRPVAPDDYSLLVKWSSAHNAAHALARLLTTNVFRESGKSIEEILDNESILMVNDASNQVLGYAMLLNLSPRDRHLTADLFAVATCPPAARMEAWLLVLDHAFKWFPVDKIYRYLVDVEPSESSLSTAMGFEEEGSLNDSVWLDGRFQTLKIFTLWRAQWTDLCRQRFLENIGLQLRYETLQNA